MRLSGLLIPGIITPSAVTDMEKNVKDIKRRNLSAKVKR